MAFQVYCQILRRSVMTPSALSKLSVPVTCSAIVFAASESEKKDSKTLIKPSELPFYDPVKEVKSSEPQKNDEEPSVVLEYIGIARREVWKLKESFSELTGEAYSTVGDVRKQVDEGIDYLRKEEHFPEQIAFITIGGITGLLLAFRKGFFKKLLYMASFAAGSAAIVYPDQASFYWETGKEHSGRTGTILYEFLNGLTRDYAGFDLPTLSDFSFSPMKNDSETAKDPPAK
ncbi:unnamed protein product [Bemisia tabaci]|uniref:MICOS complex subunit n=1 Tax=Bemisia tabaci TaxID=7038 RepID=A0A9P0F8M8_BEMTA|nr:unnamed protein product [Bemisia tabaci]